MTNNALPRIPPKHLKGGSYARADAIEAHLEAAKAENERLERELKVKTGACEFHRNRANQLSAERTAAEPGSAQRCDYVGMYDAQCGLDLGHVGEHRLFGPHRGAVKSAEGLPVKLYRDVSWNDAQGQSITFECSLCGKSETPCKHWPTGESSSVPSAAGEVTTEASSAREASGPATVGADQPWPTAWMRGVTSYCGANEPPEHDAEFSYGDDKPEGDGWVPLYRAAEKLGEQP